MKKLVLITALLAGTTIPFNGFAKKEKEKVTLRNLTAEAISAAFGLFLIYQYHDIVHPRIEPEKGKNKAWDETFDVIYKAFCGAFFINKAKSFFENFETYVGQQTKPLTDPLFDAFKEAV